MPNISSSKLKVNDPIEGTAPDAKLTIDVDATKPLRVGSYSFHLQVTDDSGNVSPPFEWTLVVVDQSRPTALIVGPPVVLSGQGFTLSGETSFDLPGGKIVKYTWTMFKAPPQ